MITEDFIYGIQTQVGMAKKVVRLTEEDLHNIVKKTIGSLQQENRLGVLYEMAYVGNMNSSLEVFVNTNDGGNVPHFHIWDSGTKGDEFHTCIRFDSPSYFHHTGKEGVLNSKERKALCEFMQSPSRNKRYSTNWEYTLSMWNDNNSNINVDEDSPMPDYRNL